jgi:hypothetical protein
MLLYRHQNAEPYHDMKIANSRFEIVAQFKYLGMTVTLKKLFQQEIERRLK